MRDRLPISLVVITLNEERNLRRCLEAAAFCSEIVIVDSASTDQTIQIANEFGARVFHRDWTGYRDQKNFGSQQASQEWILCIDADEIVSTELRADLLRRFSEGPDCDAFEMNRHAVYAGRLINHGGWYPQWRTFLYRKGCATWGGEEPHAVVQFLGRKRRLRGDLYHYTYHNLHQHLTKNVAAARDAARAMHAGHRRITVFGLLCRSFWAFVRGYLICLGFLDGFYGLVAAVFSAHYTFAKHAMLWELNRKSAQSKSGASPRES
jgi:glycosyltransferase involved in cell wall biosynthesis